MYLTWSSFGLPGQERAVSSSKRSSRGRPALLHRRLVHTGGELLREHEAASGSDSPGAMSPRNNASTTACSSVWKLVR